MSFLDLFEADNTLERLQRERLSHKVSCHERASCSRCVPYLIKDEKMEYESLWTNEVDHDCYAQMMADAYLEVHHQYRTDRFDLSRDLVDSSKTTKVPKSRKRSDGYWHIFLTVASDPSWMTHAYIIDKVEKFIQKTSIVQYLYGYEYSENINIPHVHFYLKVDNNKHFGPSEIRKHFGCRIDFQHVQNPAKCSKYIQKDITKVPSSDLFGRPSIVKSLNWIEP